MRTPAEVIRHLLCAVFVCLCGCSHRTLPNAITQIEVNAMAAQSLMEVSGVHFGQSYELLALAAKPGNAGVSFELAWRSLGKERPGDLVPIHVIDKDGNILAQADYRFPPDGGAVARGALWLDARTIPTQSLQGATALAIGVIRGTDQWLLADRGPRDWGNKRLLVTLPAKFPPKDLVFQGSLDVVNCDRIAGWAASGEDSGRSLDVEIRDRERLVTRLTASEPRPDLATGGFSKVTHGFSVSTPPQFRDGLPHSLSVRIAETRFELRNSPANVKCARK